MVLQMMYIKDAFGRSENPQQNIANQANLTVFLVSLLYLSSVSLFAFPMLRVFINTFFAPNSDNGHDASFFILFTVALGNFTLPLLNAALFPTILILRKPELRAVYRNYTTTVFFFPLTVCDKVRLLVQRRRGYTQI
jgi:hypothetical protein